MKTYCEEVLDMLNSMSDEEFDNLLLQSGLEECPVKEYQELYHKEVDTSKVEITKLEVKIKFKSTYFDEFCDIDEEWDMVA